MNWNKNLIFKTLVILICCLIVAQASENPFVFWLAGNALPGQNLKMKCFTKALSLDGNYYYAFVSRGCLRYHQGDYQEAKTDFSKALKIRDNDAVALVALGKTWMAMGEMKEAYVCFKGAVRENSTCPLVYLARGEYYEKVGEPEKALIDKLRYCRLSGNFEAALEDMNVFISLYPKVAEAYEQRALLRLEKKDYRGAEADFGKLIELKPGSAWAYFHRGSLCENQGAFPKAFEDYNKALEINRNFAEAYEGRGRLELRLEPLKAVKDFLSAGLCFLEQDRIEDALEMMKRLAGIEEGSGAFQELKKKIRDHKTQGAQSLHG